MYTERMHFLSLKGSSVFCYLSQELNRVFIKLKSVRLGTAPSVYCTLCMVACCMYTLTWSLVPIEWTPPYSWGITNSPNKFNSDYSPLSASGKMLCFLQ